MGPGRSAGPGVRARGRPRRRVRRRQAQRLPRQVGGPVLLSARLHVRVPHGDPGLRQAPREFEELGAQVLGASVDSKYSHLAWIERDFGNLGFPLLSDIKREATEAYGVLLPDGDRAARHLHHRPRGHAQVRGRARQQHRPQHRRDAPRPRRRSRPASCARSTGSPARRRSARTQRQKTAAAAKTAAAPTVRGAARPQEPRGAPLIDPGGRAGRRHEGRVMATIDDWFDERTLLGLVPADVYVRGAAGRRGRRRAHPAARRGASADDRRGRRHRPGGVEPRRRAARRTPAPAARPWSTPAST